MSELIEQSGEATVRGILESHFISPPAFDILLRDPFGPDDFEAFVAERQRTLQAELNLRKVVETTMGGDTSHVPSHVTQKVDERIARAVKKNAALDADRYQSLAGKLEYFDLRDLQDTITGKASWPQFEARFGTKEALIAKFDQLAELRNGIRHSRAVSEVVRKEGEAAILWFRQVLSK